MSDETISTTKGWSIIQRLTHPFVYFPVIASVILGVAVDGDHNWQFYALLRWVCFGAFLTMFFHGLIGKKTLSIIGIIGAILFNPLIKVHLGREVWINVDAAAALLLLWSSWESFKTVGKKDE